ncbi:MAG: SDR family oxidoreductase [Candidatus Korarchaeota archaeon]|nr:SDR family oxidoreductase [Candidatus Korarchaeota archaeon]NIU83495.1 SDR family oxidoreductase [Candidatus Thorarchaeota archaeon]NIW13762.1 SDR family oxidoreductase [Candidatus Thorarchaeota archaeon]NIW51861.1 SDR family oxidoreductase [Candidatus Korarchaeota archaeon]
MNLKEKIVLVTGSSRGIGKAIALGMADAGANIVVHCRSSVDKAEKVVASIKANGGRATVERADVRNVKDVKKMFDRVINQFGGLDVLVNNAGYGLDVPFLDITVAQWDDLFTTLPRGYFLCCQTALPHLLKRRGTIINIASTAGVVGTSGEAAYSAANGAICALTKALSKEFGPRGVRVNAILVVWATTENNPIDPTRPAHQKFLNQLSLRKATSPEDIANAAVYLCSDDASNITGVLLPVDSGYL